MKAQAGETELRNAVGEARGAIVIIAVLSGAVNVLMLGSSLYMMLVYDSVLPSRSLPTLAGLFVMIVAIFGFQALFDVFRTRLLGDVGAAFDARLAPRVNQVVFRASHRGLTDDSTAMTPYRDLESMRSFLSSPAPGAFMDMPWILVFVAVLAMLHIWLAVATLIGAAVMIFLTWLTQRASGQPTEDIARLSGRRTAVAEETRRHAETLSALGMEGRYRDRWLRVNTDYSWAQHTLVEGTAGLGGFARVFRMLLQSVVLTVGALLVIEGQATGGVIFASAILSARALAPIDQLIGSWRAFAAARSAWARLQAVLTRIKPDPETSVVLPRPKSSLMVSDLVVVPPGTQRIAARNVRFHLNAGDALGIVGMSASGKSSVVRAIVNAWPIHAGSVRLDGATLDQYDSEQLGGYIGYLPQSVELLNGSVAQNIARFDPAASSQDIVAAAQVAGVHDMIVQLPEGYDTQVGVDGARLSAGQRQRVALARALFGDPFLVVLDEPNSNLDTIGEDALDAAVSSVRDRGGLAIVVAHRPSALNRCNLILMMRDGTAQAFGPKDEILKRISDAEAQFARNKAGEALADATQAAVS